MPWIALILLLPGLSLAQTLNYDRANRAMTQQVIVPTYEALVAANAALAHTLETHCAKGESLDMATVQQGFRYAMSRWQAAQTLRFGPIRAGEGLAQFQYWPDKHGTGGKQLRRLLKKKDPAILDDGALAQKSVAISNLQTLERLLFPSSGKALQAGGFKCQLATAIAHHQTRLSVELLQTWVNPEKGHAHAMLTAAQGNDLYFDAKDATKDVLKGINEQFLMIIDKKLKRPVGRYPEEAYAKRAESWRSGQSFANIRANLASVHALMNVPGGLGDLLSQAGSDALAKGMVRDLQAIMDRIDSLPKPMRDAMTDEVLRAEVLAIQTAIEDVYELFVDTLAPEIKIPLGFNSLDGD